MKASALDDFRTGCIETKSVDVKAGEYYYYLWFVTGECLYEITNTIPDDSAYQMTCNIG